MKQVKHRNIICSKIPKWWGEKRLLFGIMNIWYSIYPEKWGPLPGSRQVNISLDTYIATNIEQWGSLCSSWGESRSNINNTMQFNKCTQKEKKLNSIAAHLYITGALAPCPTILSVSIFGLEPFLRLQGIQGDRRT